MVNSGGSRARRQRVASRGRRRRLAPDARRAELLAAGLEVLRSAGPERARVEDVTRAAGAAKGTFYQYFDSWNEFLVAVREHVSASYAASVRSELVAASRVSWSAIEREAVRVVDFIVALGEVHQAVFHGPTADVPIRPEYSAPALVAELLEAGVSAGVCRPVDPALAAPLVFAVLHATADEIARSGGRPARIEAMSALLRAWLRA